MTEHRDSKRNGAQDAKRASGASSKTAGARGDKAKGEPQRTAQSGQKQNRT